MKIQSALALLMLAPAIGRAADRLTVSAVNPLALARPGQTVELAARDLAALGETNLEKLHIRDAAGAELLCQAVDTDFDAYHRPDLLIFQADFKPGETRKFTVQAGAKHVYTRDDFRAHGRFVRERFDDFAWENDRIAHRMYGQALETWKGEPLTSSTVDIWSKRVPRMVVDEWYMVDNYHSDNGEGCDAYSAGPSRGCGGNGLWSKGRLWVSRNFVDSRVLANGPIRVMFELVYEPFDVDGRKMAETKRITLDAGSQLDCFQSFYRPSGGGDALVSGAGLKQVKGEQKEFNAAHGWLAIWEPMSQNMGMQGVAIVVDPKALDREAEDAQNNLLLVKTAPDHSVTYWAGFAWDKAGRITSADAWKKYVDEFSQGLGSPIHVRVSAE
jgi:hypothetical protein